ncbi:Tim44 domain-containing protein [Piscinibacter sakaiensis]|uniref:Tim44 domain-containing protein n=1 Tax=Piscinibacter sakaiensis TaxID=1547922 RepID=UPI003AAB837C
MKKGWLAATMSVLMVLGSAGTALVSTDAEAKRFGGARSQGLQRTTPAQKPTTPPPSQATPANAAAPAAAGAAATAGKRSWMGPIAGLAAGLGLAALMSHLGLGEEMANFLMIALMLVAAFFVIRLLMRRFGPQSATSAGPRLQAAGHGNPLAAEPMNRNMFNPPAGGSSMPAAAAAAPVAAAGSIPAGFDTEGFERIAKMIFIRMQTANDAGDLNDLRNFTTPEMFAAVRLELQERGEQPQTTDVLKVDAEVLDVAEENGQQIVSVRFHGLIREERDAAASDFDEVWHLVKPVDDSRSWAIAGIQQR